MSDFLPWYSPYSGWALMAAAALVGLAIIWRGLFGDRSAGWPRCPRCWYDRRGTPDPAAPCPECGHVPRRPRDAYRTRRHWRLAMLGLVIALALPTFAAIHRTRQHGLGYWLTYGPIYWLTPWKHVETERHGPFTVRFYVDRRAEWTGRGRLRISPGRLVEEANSEGIYRWYVAHPQGSTTRRSGDDLTGNGRANLILEAHSGGNRWQVRLYELSAAGKVVLLEDHHGVHAGYHADDDQSPIGFASGNDATTAE